MAKLTTEEIAKRLKEDIEAAESVAEVEALDNAETYQYYRAKTMGNEEDGRSKIVSSDVFEAIEWTVPAIMDIFTSDNMPDFEPEGPEDEDSAKAMTQLVRYQTWRQNDGETEIRKAVKDALMYRPGGVIKYGWDKKVKSQPKQYAGLTGMELAEMSMHEDFTITGMEETESGFNVSCIYRSTEFDGPTFEALPPGEFLRHPNAKSVKDSQFCAHKKRVTFDYLRRQEKKGLYDNLVEDFQFAGGGTNPEYFESVAYSEDNLQRGQEHSGDPARRETYLYECYVELDTDGDGMLEKRIITYISGGLTKDGSGVIRNIENLYERPTFIDLNAIEDTHKFAGITIAELVKDLQRLNTFLLRQTVNNIAQSNNSRKVYDPTRVNQADVDNNKPGAGIRVKQGVRPSEAIYELPTQSVNASVMTFFGISKELGEQRTGISKSFKSAGDSNNQTATGQLSAIQQASMRIRMIARIMWSGLSDLFRQMVFMNKKFLTKSTFIRLENRWVEITPDDLEGKMDLVLNFGMGMASKQQIVIGMQSLTAMLGQIQAATQLPVLDAANLKTMISEYVKGLGYKNVERFLPEIMKQPPQSANDAMAAEKMKNMLMEGGGGPAGVGGPTVGSIASQGTGGAATVNPSGAGVAIAAPQPGAGGVVPGYGGPMRQ